MREIKIFFDDPRKFERHTIKTLDRITGLYFIFLTETLIPYPFKQSKLIYIGMSERKSNSIGSRLASHYDGTSGNTGLKNYREREKLLFTHLNFNMLKNIWLGSIEDLESYFILDFIQKYGIYPICNNKTGHDIRTSDLKVSLKIDWVYFSSSRNHE